MKWVKKKYLLVPWSGHGGWTDTGMADCDNLAPKFRPPKTVVSGFPSGLPTQPMALRKGMPPVHRFFGMVCSQQAVCFSRTFSFLDKNDVRQLLHLIETSVAFWYRDMEPRTLTALGS